MGDFVGLWTMDLLEGKGSDPYAKNRLRPKEQYENMCIEDGAEIPNTPERDPLEFSRGVCVFLDSDELDRYTIEDLVEYETSEIWEHHSEIFQPEKFIFTSKGHGVRFLASQRAAEARRRAKQRRVQAEVAHSKWLTTIRLWLNYVHARAELHTVVNECIAHDKRLARLGIIMDSFVQLEKEFVACEARINARKISRGSILLGTTEAIRFPLSVKRGSVEHLAHNQSELSFYLAHGYK